MIARARSAAHAALGRLLTTDLADAMLWAVVLLLAAAVVGMLQGGGWTGGL